MAGIQDDRPSGYVKDDRHFGGQSTVRQHAGASSASSNKDPFFSERFDSSLAQLVITARHVAGEFGELLLADAGGYILEGEQGVSAGPADMVALLASVLRRPGLGPVEREYTLTALMKLSARLSGIADKVQVPIHMTALYELSLLILLQGCGWPQGGHILWGRQTTEDKCAVDVAVSAAGSPAWGIGLFSYQRFVLKCATHALPHRAGCTCLRSPACG